MRDLLITINDTEYSMISDFASYVKKYEPADPEPKLYQTEVPFSDGILDLTEYYGEVKYNNRELVFPMLLLCNKPEKMHRRLASLIHGQNILLKTSTDPEWYFEGRAKISGLQTSGLKWEYELSMDAKPFKYRDNEAVYTASSDGNTVTIWNEGKTCIPTFTATDETDITFGDNTYSLSADSTATFSGIVLSAGSNELTLTGTGTVTITWQERAI